MSSGERSDRDATGYHRSHSGAFRRQKFSAALSAVASQPKELCRTTDLFRPARGEVFMQRIRLLLAITASCLLAAHTPVAAIAAADDPPYTFRSDVSLGRVDAQVVDRGNHPIRGLRVQDFILRVDGKPQEIRNFQTEKMPVDVVLLLDVSHSMEPHIRRVATASHQALRALGDQDRIATMVFDRSTRLRMPFRPSRLDAERELESVLDRETFQGG